MATVSNSPSTKPVATSEATPAGGLPAGHEYVIIPKKNILGWDHPGVGINLKHWGPGKHVVTEELAGEINGILERYNNEMIRILRPEVDQMAQRKSQDFIG